MRVVGEKYLCKKYRMILKYFQVHFLKFIFIHESVNKRRIYSIIPAKKSSEKSLFRWALIKCKVWVKNISAKNMPKQEILGSNPYKLGPAV